MAAKLKSEIVAAFKMHGLSLRSESSRYLTEVLTPVDARHRNLWLDKIIEIIQKQPLPSATISRDVCETAVRECNAEQDEDADKIFVVIDAFSVPRYTYSSDRKKFLPDSSLGIPAPSLHGMATDKINLFRNRYTVLQQRTLRHDLFIPPAVGETNTEGEKKFQLKPIENLLGSVSNTGELILLGMLTQLKEGKWFLEDPTGSVPVSLANTNFHTGLFTENSFVLAEGVFEDGIFNASAIGLPPPEPARTTRAYFGSLNFFGGPLSVCAKASGKLQRIERENQDAMMVFLSDLWLDQIKVMERLQQLFAGYEECPPTCFVFCGNFLSSPQDQGHGKLFKEHLQSLATLITQFPSLVQSSKFVFVPGPQDPGSSVILPRPAIPASLTADFLKKVPSAIFTSNPCRIQYCTKEVVVLREDIVTKMCRHCVRFPEDKDVPTHFAKTVVSQGHLCPLPLHVCPVYWAFDNALSVYPLPDVIVCADKFDPFCTTTVDTMVLNPGSFPMTQFGFRVYYPATGEVQDCQIQD